MPLTYVGPENTICFGYLDFTGEIGYNYSTPSLINVAGYIADILPEVSIVGQPYHSWNCNWFLNLYTSSFLSNTSKFASAVPKFNLGYADFIYAGMQTSNIYWNYQSQRFPVFACNINRLAISYPSKLEPVSFSDSNNGITIGVLGRTLIGNYASDVYILPYNADIETIATVIYFQAAVSTGSVPWAIGDI